MDFILIIKFPSPFSQNVSLHCTF